MGNGLTTQNSDISRNQAMDMNAHRRGTQGPDAIGAARGPTVDELPEPNSRPAPRLVQPGTHTPPGSLANIINGHNVPADNAPESCVKVVEGASAPAT